MIYCTRLSKRSCYNLILKFSEDGRKGKSDLNVAFEAKHARGRDPLEAVLKINVKMLFSNHTVQPEAYKKIAKKITLVKESIEYEL